MPDVDDIALLREFVDNHSESAFATIVQRRVNLVYSVALRLTGNSEDAQDVTQAVFVILARKAAGLRPKTILTGWLYETTRFAAMNFLTRNHRRQAREQEALMQSILNEAETVWPQLAPLLESAMSRLNEKDRTLVALRFYENQSMAETAAVLGINEPAARKRAERVVEKLRAYFTKRGVHSTAETIAGALSANSIQTAPVALAKTATAVALAKGSIAAASTMTLAEGTMKAMTWLKIKFAMGVGAAALLMGGMATIAISQTGNHGQLTAREILKESQNAYAALTSYSDDGTIIAQVGNESIPTTFKIRLQRPDLYRVAWTQTTKYFTNGGVVWSDGHGDFLGQTYGDYKSKPANYHNMQSALSAAAGISGQASSTIPGVFFKDDRGDVLKEPTSGPGQFARQKDEVIAGVDCYVVSSTMGPATLPNHGMLPDNAGKIGKRTTTLWIGKHDYLIHQARTVVEGASFKLPTTSDAEIKRMLARQNKPATPKAIAALRAQLETANKIALSNLASLASGKIISTRTHENIVVDQKFSPADFTP